MLNPKFSSMYLIITYVGWSIALVLVVAYDEWLLLPLLVECYKFLMLIMLDEPLVQVVMDIKDLFSSIETNVNILKQLVVRELDCFC